MRENIDTQKTEKYKTLMDIKTENVNVPIAKAFWDARTVFSALTHSFLASSEPALIKKISDSLPSLVQIANLVGSSSTPSVWPIWFV